MAGPRGKSGVVSPSCAAAHSEPPEAVLAVSRWSAAVQLRITSAVGIWTTSGRFFVHCLGHSLVKDTAEARTIAVRVCLRLGARLEGASPAVSLRQALPGPRGKLGIVSPRCADAHSEPQKPSCQ